MEVSLTNILMMLVLQVMFLSFYHFLLARSADLQFSRFFLIITFLISILAPFIDKEFIYSFDMIPTYLLPEIDKLIANELETASNQTQVIQVLSYIYAFGCIAVAARLLYGLIRMTQILISSPILKVHQHYVVQTDRVATSSFGPILFWNPHQSLLPEESELVKQHELSHIKEWHSLDILMIELTMILMWFNPMVYLYKSAIAQNHEFIADRSGAKNKKQTYAALLLKATLNAEGISMASHFSKINTKRRIMELAKTNNRVSGPVHYVATLIIAVMAFFTLSLSATYAQGGPQDKVYEEVDQLPKYVGGMAALGSRLQQVLEYPKEERKKGIQGKVFVAFVVTKNGEVTQIEIEKGISSLCDKAAVAAVSKLPDWEPGIHNGKPVNVRVVLPINFELGDVEKGQ